MSLVMLDGQMALKERLVAANCGTCFCNDSLGPLCSARSGDVLEGGKALEAGGDLSSWRQSSH